MNGIYNLLTSWKFDWLDLTGLDMVARIHTWIILYPVIMGYSLTEQKYNENKEHGMFICKI